MVFVDFMDSRFEILRGFDFLPYLFVFGGNILLENFGS